MTTVLKVSDANFGVRQEAAVIALREMRAVHPKIYNNNLWRRKVKVRYLFFYTKKKIDTVYSHWGWPKPFLRFASQDHLVNGIVLWSLKCTVVIAGGTLLAWF